MLSQSPSLRTSLLYSLLLGSAVVLTLPFYAVGLRLAIRNVIEINYSYFLIYGLLLLSALVILIGTWTIIQNVRGKHHQPRLLGPAIAIVGVLMASEYLFFFVMLELWIGCYHYGNCL